jgi:glycosyltransferase involved in cell wall biosynthesis
LVLMTADTVGGVWTYSLELCAALVERGLRVAIATMGSALLPSQWEEARAIPGTTIYESPYRLEWMEDPWDDVERAGSWLLELDQQLEPEIIHLNGYAHGALPFSKRPIVVGHSCVLSWWEAVHGGSVPERYHRYQQVVREGLRGARLVIAPTQFMLNCLERHYGPLAQAQVIFNGRSSRRFAAAENKQPLILSAGRLWDEAKNIGALGKVAAGLPWPVRVAGEGPPISDVQMLGKLSSAELAQQMSVASIYALPARYEPFGLSALEAALSGCALVLGDISSLREVWGPAALYVSPDSAADLLEVLQTLISSPPMLRTYSTLARRRARQLTAERMAEAYLTAYSIEVSRRRASGMD